MGLISVLLDFYWTLLGLNGLEWVWSGFHEASLTRYGWERALWVFFIELDLISMNRMWYGVLSGSLGKKKEKKRRWWRSSLAAISKHCPRRVPSSTFQNGLPTEFLPSFFCFFLLHRVRPRADSDTFLLMAKTKKKEWKIMPFLFPHHRHHHHHHRLGLFIKVPTKKKRKKKRSKPFGGH